VTAATMDWSIIAATAFEAEHVAFLDRLAQEAEVELLALEVEDLDRRVGRCEAGHRWARRLGLAPRDADLVARLLYDADLDVRRHAATALCSRVRLRAGVAVIPVREMVVGDLWR
jgi:hypothetical protein